jgi:hypothetical protein
MLASQWATISNPLFSKHVKSGDGTSQFSVNDVTCLFQIKSLLLYMSLYNTFFVFCLKDVRNPFGQVIHDGKFFEIAIGVFLAWVRASLAVKTT